MKKNEPGSSPVYVSVDRADAIIEGGALIDAGGTLTDDPWHSGWPTFSHLVSEKVGPVFAGFFPI